MVLLKSFLSFTINWKVIKMKNSQTREFGKRNPSIFASLKKVHRLKDSFTVLGLKSVKKFLNYRKKSKNV